MKRYIFLTLIIVSLCFLFQIQSSIAASANKPSTKVKKTLSPKSITVDKIILKPDLTVTTFLVSPSNPKYGEPITMTVMAKNIGAGDAEDSFQITLYYIKHGTIHRVKLKNLNTGLGAGKEYVLTGSFVPWESTSYKLVAMVDKNNEVAEIREGNNFKVKDISIPQEPNPDLIVSKINMSPKNPDTHDKPVLIWVFVKNIGPGKSAPCYLSKQCIWDNYLDFNYSNPDYWRKTLIPSLNPGQERMFQTQGFCGWRSALEPNANYGPVTCRYIIDKANEVLETNENNNTLDISYEITCSYPQCPDE